MEDAPNGVQAASAAGMQSIWVPDAMIRSLSDVGHLASLTLSSLEEFVPEAFGLPPYDDQ